MREAFLRVSEGKALLLPQMLAIGDMDEKSILRISNLEKAVLEAMGEWQAVIDEYPRLLQLTQLVSSYNRQLSTGQALQLAEELAELLDEIQREQADIHKFDTLVPAEFAAQWLEVLAFLNIVLESWPKHLQESGYVEPWQRRNQILSLLTRQWELSPPDFPVIAAGTTGSIPATAALLKVIAKLPQGSVVLPGLDLLLDAEAWQNLEESHPQYGLKQLLDNMEVRRENILPLFPAEPSEREKWVSLALQPAETAQNWQQAKLDAQAATDGCEYIICGDIQDEAKTIALLMRDVLEVPGKTAALITPNRNLARRVRSQLQRWHIAIDDSAGTAMDRLPVGNFLLLLLECVEEKNEPVSLLSVLKHPLARLGRPAGIMRNLIRELEIVSLRGIKPHSIASLQAGLRDKRPHLEQLLIDFERALEPLAALALQDESPSVNILLMALLQAANLLTKDEHGNVLMEVGEEAREIASLMTDLKEASKYSLAVPFRDFRNLLKFFLHRASFRSAWKGHARLHILSPMEARVQSADRIILGSLNEGDWPASVLLDPWLNRPMRKALGLPAPEKEMGQAAHDFSLLASAPEVYFTRAQKAGGAATVPSRYLQRMEAVLKVAGGQAAIAIWKSGDRWREWAAMLDEEGDTPSPIRPPQPVPPLAARPRRLSVTSLEKLMRDPYGIYAQKILGLKALDALQQLPQGREFGQAVHRALENFIMKGGLRAENPKNSLLEEGRLAFAEFGDAFMVESLWWPRFESIAEWVLKQDWATHSLCEISGKWQFMAPAGEFTVTATVDRLDHTPEGVVLIDYKTGGAPKGIEIQRGLALQLVLAGVMVGKGSFGKDLSLLPVTRMEYWKLAGGVEGGEIKEVIPEKNSSLEALIENTEIRIKELISEFDNPRMPYRSVPDWRLQPRYNDYKHLERIAEWMYS